MIKVKSSELKTGQILAKSIEKDNGSVLLYEGAKLRNEHINKIIENNIEFVFVEEEMQKDAEMYSVETFERESVDKIKDAVETRIHTRDEAELTAITETAVNIISDVVSNVDVANCMIEVKRESNDLYAHMLSVASLATVMGIKIGFSEKQLKDTATGALLHDIGLCKVEVPFYDVEMDRMPAAEKLNYRKHVITGYELVQGYNWLSETSKMIILSHHERADGSGYPFRKIAERIPIEVRLVSICDHLDEMVNGIGYKKRKMYEVVEYFRTNEAFLFDFELLSQVTSAIAWFPTGSKVLTNEGELAQIVKQNRGLPDRPIIKILKYSDGTDCIPPIEKDLTEHLTIFILESVDN